MGGALRVERERAAGGVLLRLQEDPELHHELAVLALRRRVHEQYILPGDIPSIMLRPAPRLAVHRRDDRNHFRPVAHRRFGDAQGLPDPLHGLDGASVLSRLPPAGVLTRERGWLGLKSRAV